MTIRKFAALLALLAAGCGGEGKPATAPAAGKVTFNKTTPPVGALVVFHPADKSLGRAMGGTPLAKVKDDGTFTLTTYESGDGAPPGEYGVTIDWRPQPKGAPRINLGDEGNTGGKPALKPKFSNPNEPAFKVTVTEAGPNDFTFEVD